MIHQVALLLLFQLIGEVLSRLLALPIPGPVIGMMLLFVAGTAWPALIAFVGPSARVILANLALLFVPAGVGVVGHLDMLARDGAAIAAVLVISTILAMLASVGTFLAVSHLLDSTP